MKHEYLEQRDKDLVKAYFEVKKVINRIAPNASTDLIFKLAACATAPRYYVSLEYAKRYVSLIEHNKELKQGNDTLGYSKLKKKANEYFIQFEPNTRAMYYELHRKLSEYCHGRIYSYAPLAEIIYEPASSFFISPEVFQQRVYKQLKKIKK